MDLRHFNRTLQNTPSADDPTRSDLRSEAQRVKGKKHIHCCCNTTRIHLCTTHCVQETASGTVLHLITQLRFTSPPHDKKSVAYAPVMCICVLATVLSAEVPASPAVSARPRQLTHPTIDYTVSHIQPTGSPLLQLLKRVPTIPVVT